MDLEHKTALETDYSRFDDSKEDKRYKWMLPNSESFRIRQTRHYRLYSAIIVAAMIFTGYLGYKIYQTSSDLFKIYKNNIETNIGE